MITTHGRNEQLETMAKEFNIPGLGSSDFHALDEIGLVGTKVFGNCLSYEDVLKAIKEKEVEAFFRRALPSELIR